jgi:hypothetical protein
MHVIRLHGPWTAEITTDDTESRRVHLPRDWSELAKLARQSSVRLIRRFHRPTGLGEATQVLLAIPVGWPVGSLSVNGRQLLEYSTVDERRLFDLSKIVRSHESHDLAIEFRTGGQLEGQPYFVAIEIEEPA